jgi:hypothetical protein
MVAGKQAIKMRGGFRGNSEFAITLHYPPNPLWMNPLSFTKETVVGS